jgi:hypothetical protein
MARCDLSSHFLQAFLYSEEPFAIIQGRLYTLSRTNGHFCGGSAFHFLGQKYALEESEEISQLEKEIFSANRGGIERMMTRQIQENFVSEVEKRRTELKKMQNIYSSLQDVTIERFIMIDVFNEYNHEKGEGQAKKDVKVSDWDDIPDIKKTMGVHDLVSQANSLDPLIGSFGFIVIRNKCYSLYQNSGKRNEEKGYVVFGKKTMDLKPWVSLKELCSTYTQKLIERISQKAVEHGKKFDRILEQMEQEKQQLDEAIKDEQMFTEKTEGRRGEIGFRKIRESEYQVSVAIPPYIIEKNGEFYFFGPVSLGVIVKADNGRIMLDNMPRVMEESMPYMHPFVFHDKVNYSRLCFGDLNWKNRRNILFNTWYDITEKKSTAEKIARAIKEGKILMQNGYSGIPYTDFKPVRSIESCNCKIAGSRAAAEQYARANGIPIERIIKNE